MEDTRLFCVSECVYSRYAHIFSEKDKPILPKTHSPINEAYLYWLDQVVYFHDLEIRDFSVGTPYHE
jgi:hypothetical protein